VSTKPWEVQSNLIARTAHCALKLLQAVRERSGKSIPLAWQPNYESDCAAIEVYPAATLEARGHSSLGYKKGNEIGRREELASVLSDEMVIEMDLDDLVKTDDTFDAALCLLAASDFLDGKCFNPSDDKIAQVRKESWIWVRKPDSTVA
jgi:Protein of unknown function (DUF429)